MKPFVIAIANEKGGVAKTTTTLSLGASLAAMSQNVLLVDLDPQADLSLSLGLSPAGQTVSLLTFFSKDTAFNELIMATEVPRLKIIPGKFENAGVENLDPAIPSCKLRKGIADIAEDFSYVIVDCPPHIGFLTKSALVASDLLILPTQAEYFSIYALRTMINIVRDIRSDPNPDITYKLLLTLFDKRNRIHRSLSDELRNTFGAGVLNTVIEIDTKLRESQVVGLPINQVAPSSRSALQYRDLAQEIESYAKAKRN